MAHARCYSGMITMVTVELVRFSRGYLNWPFIYSISDDVPLSYHL